MDDASPNLSRRWFLRGRSAQADAVTPIAEASEPVPLVDPVAQIGDACLARRNVECRVCGEACELSAIRFRPRLGSVVQPDVVLESCSGCADCVAVCPTQAIECIERAAEQAASDVGQEGEEA